ncbi:MAG: chemotaxis protein CheW [Burkholderiales bacterium]|nr:chemotaxis protein CheW [Burkholderiales bacterium]
MAPAAIRPGFGGFRIGGMELGLPMQVLREVVPCQELIRLPCAASCVTGGINLRGIMVPVIDLRILFGMPTPHVPFQSVMIMIHENRLLGLLTEGVTGVFTGETSEINHVHFAAADQSVFYGSIRRADNGTLVNLLSPAALAMLRDVPLAEHREMKKPTGIQADTANSQNKDQRQGQDKVIPVLLLRCNQIALTIDAMEVYTTLSDPEIKPSPLAMGSCRGVIEYAGSKIPVLDLLEVCGFGKIEPDTPLQAFLVQLPKGMAAFLVNKVIDVVRIRTGEIIDVPAYALPRSALFSGAIPKSSLPASCSQQDAILASQFLVLNGAGMKSCHEITALANVSAPEQMLVRHNRPQPATTDKTGRKRTMVTYLLGSETATPFEQIREILPFSHSIPIFEQTGPLLGMIVVRGRSIPVVCLHRLITGQPAQKAATNILVVEIDHEAIGFAIPALKSIETVEWEPELPQFGGEAANDDLKRAIRSNRLAQIGNGNSIRMLPVLDLEKIGRAFRAQQLAVA